VTLGFGAVNRKSRVCQAATSAPPETASATVHCSMRCMTHRDEVPQLMYIPFSGSAPNVRSREYRDRVSMIRDTHVGGFVLANVANGRFVGKAEPYALAQFLNRVQRLPESHSS
jgi:hypothetical protein